MYKMMTTVNTLYDIQESGWKSGTEEFTSREKVFLVYMWDGGC